jgi:hypothetical protein
LTVIGISAFLIVGVLIRTSLRAQAVMPIQTRILYTSPNGDRWLLCQNTETNRVFVRHEPNAPSGGRASQIDIGTFLSRGPLNPEHQALLRLIGTLVQVGRCR